MQTVIITGAAAGLGADAANRFVAQGDYVVSLDINEEGLALQHTQLNTPEQHQYHCVDVSNKSQVQAVINDVVKQRSRIDVVINNAGIEHSPTPMHLVSDHDMERNFAVNIKGVWYMMQAVIPQMLSQGHGNIINVASVAGLRSAPMIAAYGASKHAVVGLTKATAVEYARQGIRINAVCPSFVDTQMVQRTLARLDERAQAGIVKANPMRRLGNIEEITAAIVWLASDEASFMTGQCMTLDGGMTA
jgi:NAD(P)-dependent dehydrogenase (short-subunit alcohol dehydrogenase family)